MNMLCFADNDEAEFDSNSSVRFAMKSLMKRTGVVFLILVFIVAGAAWYLHQANGEPVAYRTAAVKRGDLVVTIAASGTVEPEEVIDVGAQVAGQIVSFGKDKNGKTIDYGSTVQEGTVLAQIDDSLYAADASEAAAQLKQAKAGLLRSQADLEQMKAKLYQAQRDWERAQKLGPSEALAASSYDAYRSAYETAKANVSVAEAAIEQARAAIAQAQAGLQRAQRNLGYCTIRSPVNGVIIDRRVNIGQTVVSSLNAPSLFLIAKDLKRMQVWVPVNEADIGNIRPGQSVSFTVDAYPGQVFRGVVGKIRLNASMTQNVVTYTVEIITDNSDGKLLPYLTANVEFELNRRSQVLLVPNAALRWSPQPGQVVPELQTTGLGASGRNGNSGEIRPSQTKSAQDDSDSQIQGVVWVPQGDRVRPVGVLIGPSDGTLTEIDGSALQAGQEVVVGDKQPTTAATATTNPFTPQLRRGNSAKR
jgi:HlyD family secretion protein